MTPETIDVLWKLAADRMIGARQERLLARQQMSVAHPVVEILTKEIDKLATALIELKRLKFPSQEAGLEAANEPGRTEVAVGNWCSDCERYCYEPGAVRRGICPECGGAIVRKEPQRAAGAPA